jgi:hypothetical protein
MKTTKQIIFASLFALLCLANYAGTKEKEQLGELNEKLTQNSISFTENKGQIVDQNYIARPDVYFGGQSKGLTFHLRNNGISYQLNRVDTYKEVINKRTGEKSKTADQQTIYRIDINWLNANTRSSILKEQVIDGESNYYTAGCPDNGALHVRSYNAVTYQNLYTGIDLKWYEKNGELKYDYLCAAGSDYHQIQLQIKGAEELKINSKGELEIKTPLGTIVEKAPLVLQNEKPLKSNWVLIKNADGTENLSFNIQNLNSAIPYIIDPVVRLWGTYYGGSGSDYAQSSSTDASGSVYMTGFTISNTNIATAGAHQTTFGGNNDAYLVKFNSAGVRQWGTYYGGSGSDFGISCIIDASGNVYVSGYTDSNTNIATAGAHQTTIAGFSDAYLVKFNSAGVRQWGTYYGGTGDDNGHSCNTDASGNVYLTGDAGSNTNIATVGAHQANFGGGSFDAYLVKFNSAGVRQWGTYYGGTGDDYGYSCITDVSGNVYMTGEAGSNTNIATAGAHQTAFGGGNFDAYLVKFNSAGVRQWGTYFGGSGNDSGYSCSTDALGNVYMSGFTNSNTNIATSGAHQTTVGGSNDAYLVKFNSAGIRQWGSYYGGSGSDSGYSCSTDASGNVYMTGGTQSITNIATSGAHQPTFGGIGDAYLVKFNSAGIRQWGTYYGGTGNDSGNSCNIDALGNAYMAGTTDSNSGIATAGAHQTTFGGGSFDAFLVKFSDCVAINPIATVNATVCAGAALNFTASISGTITPTYSWSGPNSFTSNIQNPSITNAGTVNIGVYTLTVNNSGCVETTTTQVSSVSACTGINQLVSNSSDYNFLVYPNPSKGVFNIECKDTDPNSLKVIEVADALGRILISDKINKAAYELNLTNYVNGIYFIKVIEDGKAKTVKVVKE